MGVSGYPPANVGTLQRGLDKILYGDFKKKVVITKPLILCHKKKAQPSGLFDTAVGTNRMKVKLSQGNSNQKVIMTVTSGFSMCLFVFNSRKLFIEYLAETFHRDSNLKHLSANYRFICVFQTQINK